MSAGVLSLKNEAACDAYLLLRELSLLASGVRNEASSSHEQPNPGLS